MKKLYSSLDIVPTQKWMETTMAFRVKDSSIASIVESSAMN